jgi:hypothetical protein
MAAATRQKLGQNERDKKLIRLSECRYPIRGRFIHTLDLFFAVRVFKEDYVFDRFIHATGHTRK